MLQKRLNEHKKHKFITSAEEDLTPKSFLDKHYKTIAPAKFFSYFFSFISVLFGCIAIYTTLLQLLGIKTPLLNSFEAGGWVAILLIVISILLLAFYEAGKHHFYTEGFLDYYRGVSGYGLREIGFAAILQIISISLSAYGGYIAAAEITGIEKAKQLTAIESEFLPIISQAKADLQSFKDAKTWRVKISDSNTPELNRLQQTVDNLEAQFLEAKRGAGVLGFVAETTEGTNKMIFILAGSQVLIEIFLTFCLWWLIYIKSRAVYEANIQSEEIPFFFKAPAELKGIEVNNAMITAEPQRKIGFHREHKPEPQYPQSKLQTPQTIEAQRTQETEQSEEQSSQPIIIDLSNEKKRVRTYIKRIEKSYTKTLLERLKTDISKLANFGYKVEIEDGKVTIKQSIPRGSRVFVQYSYGKIKIDYV